MKFYTEDETDEDVKNHNYPLQADQFLILQEIFLLISKRDDNACNFVDSSNLKSCKIAKQWASTGTRILYRHYATLYFVFVCEQTESELGILDLIQVFVETLDKCFENVCELDLIFNSDKVHYILDEIVVGGLVLETNMGEILLAVKEMNKLEKEVQ